MSQQISARQQQILALLLQDRNGLSVDELAKALDISRTAIQQHFISLEGEGYIKKTAPVKTAGRPVNKYVLAEKGIDCFPKQYAWFSELMLDDLRQEISPERFTGYMQRLGLRLADSLRSKFVGKELEARLDELLGIMDGLGFHVQLGRDEQNGATQIIARNCIYHELAQKHHEVCTFDITLMSSLLDEEITHTRCMAKGETHCCFAVGNKNKLATTP